MLTGHLSRGISAKARASCWCPHCYLWDTHFCSLHLTKLRHCLLVPSSFIPSVGIPSVPGAATPSSVHRRRGPGPRTSWMATGTSSAPALKMGRVGSLRNFGVGPKCENGVPPNFQMHHFLDFELHFEGTAIKTCLDRGIVPSHRRPSKPWCGSAKGGMMGVRIPWGSKMYLERSAACQRTTFNYYYIQWH